MALLDIAHLAFRVVGQVVLADIEMTVGEGEIHALLGANGTGKTTIACLLMGCAGYAPTAGRMRFRGRDLAALPMHERARLGLTMAWQEPARIEGLPVWTYLTLGCPAVDPARRDRRRHPGIETPGRRGSADHPH